MWVSEMLLQAAKSEALLFAEQIGYKEATGVWQDSPPVVHCILSSSLNLAEKEQLVVVNMRYKMQEDCRQNNGIQNGE